MTGLDQLHLICIIFYEIPVPRRKNAPPDEPDGAFLFDFNGG